MGDIQMQTFFPVWSPFRGHFFSDTHLFHPHNGAAKLHLQMLYVSSAEQIYAVGDTFDFETLVIALQKRGLCLETMPEHFEDLREQVAIPDFEFHMRFVDCLLWKAAQRSDVTIITGNHDIGLDLLNGHICNGLACKTEAVYDSGAKKYLVGHGHLFDPAYFDDFTGIYSIGSSILSSSLWFDHKIGKLIPHFRKNFTCINFVKQLGKSYVHGFIERAMTKAKLSGLDGIICGHIHKQDRRDHLLCLYTRKVKSGGIEYINCGDGLTHGTSVIHNYEDGEDQWAFLGEADIPASAAAILAKENPLADYREQSTYFMQRCWSAHLHYLRMKERNELHYPELGQVSGAAAY